MVSFLPRPNSPVSISANPPAREDEWVCDGLDDELAVQALAFQTTPGAVATAQGILYRQDVRLSRQGHQLFYVNVPYAPRDRSKLTWDGETSGGTFTIKTSRQHIASYVAPGQAIKDHKGAIGRLPDGTVEGVPIVIPAMKLNVTVVHPYGMITLAYMRFIHSITSMVNSSAFLGWNPGEVLFLGARMSDGTECEASATYSFAMERNLANALIGGITVVTKQGHDFAWVEFRNDAIDGVPVTIPRQIDVCRVYERANLAQLLGFGA